MEAHCGQDEAERRRCLLCKPYLFPVRKCRRVANDRQPNHIQRQYKKMMVREGMRPPPGIVDPDFNIDISDDEHDDEY